MTKITYYKHSTPDDHDGVILNNDIAYKKTDDENMDYKCKIRTNTYGRNRYKPFFKLHNQHRNIVESVEDAYYCTIFGFPTHRIEYEATKPFPIGTFQIGPFYFIPDDVYGIELYLKEINKK